jgi:MFS family permease
MYPTAFLLGSTSLVLWLPSTTVAPLILFACLFGFFSGMFVTVTSPVIARISPEDKLGARIGAFFSVVAIASLVGTPIGGAMIPKGGDVDREAYRGVILYAVRLTFLLLRLMYVGLIRLGRRNTARSRCYIREQDFA